MGKDLNSGLLRTNPASGQVGSHLKSRPSNYKSSALTAQPGGLFCHLVAVYTPFSRHKFSQTLYFLATERERQLTMCSQIKQLAWPMADQQITHRKWRLLLPRTLSHHQLTFLLLLNHPISHLLVLFHLKYKYEAFENYIWQ